jgi:putative chitinase
MPGALANIPSLLPTRSSFNPATAAAVAIMSARPIAEPPMAGLDRPLAAVAPHLSVADRASWVAALTAPLRKAGITSPRSVAAFLGQCAVESSGFLGLEENLSYSAGRLCQVWPSRFPTVATAGGCAFKPEVLANQVYADRMGNGGIGSGDGWQFRGRGLIQLSGRTNYTRFATEMKLPLDDAIRHAATQAGAADSAAWFWSINGLNALAAAWSIDLITRKINGGTNGSAERSRLCEAALHAIGA